MLVKPDTREPFCVIGMLDDILYECLKYECCLMRFDLLSWRYHMERCKPDIAIFSYNSISYYFKPHFDNENISTKISEFDEMLNYCDNNNIKSILWIDNYDVEINLFIPLLDRKFDAVFSVCPCHVEKSLISSKNCDIFYLPLAAQLSLFNPANKDLERIGIISSPEECLKMSCCYALMSCFYKKFEILSIQKFNDAEKHFVPYYIFDMLSCGKIVVCPDHKHIKELLGKGIKFANNEHEFDSLCYKYSANKNLCDKLSLINLRQIIRSHTYKHRLIEILSKVNLDYIDNTTIDGATIICIADNYAHIYTTIYNYISQNIQNKHLVFIINNNFISKSEVDKIVSHLENVNVCFYDSQSSYYKCVENAIMNSSFNYIAFFNPEDYYLPHYLSDALNCFVYSHCKIAGKKTLLIYNQEDGSIQLEFPGQEERYCRSIAKWTCVAEKEVFCKVDVSLFLENSNKFFNLCNLYGFKVYSSNRFNYIHRCSE